MAIFGTLGEADLSAVSASISDTAVDVFVYDTTKDSDGGAWRKRTQNTSWYNETLNTSIRGSRKEFPAVAVIVVESLKVTIYDGDDPDLPMWMVFNGGVGSTSADTTFLGTLNVPTSTVFMLNGVLCVGFSSSGGWGVSEIRFVSDSQRWFWTAGIYKQPANSIAERNVGSVYVAVDTSASVQLVSAIVNDVAMTVLPNAPIDPSTGLPIPTIAVATDGGVSVIKDDGNVVDTTSNNGSYTYARSVEWASNGDLLFVLGDTNGSLDYLHTYDGFNSSDNVITVDTKNGTTKNVRSSFRHADTTTAYASHQYDGFTVRGSNGAPNYAQLHPVAKKDPFEYGVKSPQGLTQISENPDSKESLIAGITSSFNTGYMHGDIKGAFLSDTTAESLTANTNLAPSAIANGTNRLSSETYESGDTSWSMVDASGTANGYVKIEFINLVVGQTYFISMDWDGNATLDGGYSHKIQHQDGTGSENFTEFTHWNKTNGSSETLTGLFTAQTTDNENLVMYANAITLNVSNFNVRAVDDEDRSVNNNGLAVFGTITKSAVATGAELVAYSGFSASNYLQQPYNSDLAPGTAAYSVSCWFKTGTSSGDQYIFDRNGGGAGSRNLLLIMNTSAGNPNKFQFWHRDNSGNITEIQITDKTITDNVWHQVVALNDGTNYRVYVDGEVSSITNTGNPIRNVISDNNPPMFVGIRHSEGSTFMTGSMALFRYSLSAPSSEQIKKMYEDEKHLFQENAKATLYGSSDAVTALAYDDTTNLLHVGTSDGRSDFQGLCQINNTTDPVTTAISAQDSLIIEQ